MTDTQPAPTVTDADRLVTIAGNVSLIVNCGYKRDMEWLLAEVERLRAQRDAAMGIAFRWCTEAAVARADGQDDYTIYAEGAGQMILRAIGVKAP